MLKRSERRNIKTIYPTKSKLVDLKALLLQPYSTKRIYDKVQVMVSTNIFSACTNISVTLKHCLKKESVMTVEKWVMVKEWAYK